MGLDISSIKKFSCDHDKKGIQNIKYLNETNFWKTDKNSKSSLFLKH